MSKIGIALNPSPASLFPNSPSTWTDTRVSEGCSFDFPSVIWILFSTRAQITGLLVITSGGDNTQTQLNDPPPAWLFLIRLKIEEVAEPLLFPRWPTVQTGWTQSLACSSLLRPLHFSTRSEVNCPSHLQSSERILLDYAETRGLHGAIPKKVMDIEWSFTFGSKPQRDIAHVTRQYDTFAL